MIFLFILAIYSVALWNFSVPLTGDQKVYLSVALEMKEKSSLIIPFLFDHANFLKPPFQYWMTLLGWKVFGFSLFGALFPSVLALVGAAFLVKKLSPEKGNLSALIFASTLATMTYGTTAQMEIWIVLFYLAAWLFYSEKKLFLTFITVGVMAWIKGPLYPALFVLSVFGKEYFEGHGKELLRPKLIMCLLMGILVGLAWYAAAALTHFDELRMVFLGRENFGKMQTAQGSPFGLWEEFMVTLFPILFLLIASLFDASFRARFKTQRSLWLTYASLPAVFFTLFPYRVNTYLYLLTPLVAWMVIETPKPRKEIFLSIQILVGLVTLFLLGLDFRLASGEWITYWLAGLIAITLGAWSYGHFRFRATWIALSALVLVNLIRIGATQIGEWDLKPLREHHGEANAYFIGPSQEDIWHEFGLVSAALGLPVGRIQNSEEEKKFLDQGGVILLSDEQSAIPGAQCEPWRRLKRRMKFPIRELLQSGMSIEDPKLHRIFQICRGIK